MSNYETKTLAQRKAWGAKMAAARAAKQGKVVYKGRGAYKAVATAPSVSSKKRSGTGVRKTARALGGAAGATIGTALGGPTGTVIGGVLGSGLGHMAGEAIKYFTGRGDYQVRSNSLLEAGGDMPPIMNAPHHKGTVFRRCEYLGDIISGNANTFAIQSFPVNPGLESTFLWLSQVAANYEQYSIEGMYFEFRTMSADALSSTNTALGQVIMAASYNAANPNFTSKQQMENYEGGVSTKPSQSCRYFVECEKSQTVLDDLYIRSGAVPSGQDQRFFDLCNFQIATNGLQAGQVNLGELWVCYEVVLMKPKMFSALGLYGSYFRQGNTAFDNTHPLGNGTATNNPLNNLNLTVQTSTVLIWPFTEVPQEYYVNVEWIGAGAVTPVYPTVTANGGTGTIKATTKSPDTAGSGLDCMLSFYFTTVASVSPSITFGVGGTLPTAQSQVIIQVIQVPNGA